VASLGRRLANQLRFAFDPHALQLVEPFALALCETSFEIFLAFSHTCYIADVMVPSVRVLDGDLDDIILVVELVE